MTTILVECPNCTTRFKLKNAEQLDGTKVRCKKCRSPFRIQVPRAATVREPEEDEVFDVGEEAIVDDEPVADEYEDDLFPAASPAPARLPSKKNVFRGPAPAPVRSGAKKSTGGGGGGSAGSAKKKDKTSGGERKKNTTVVVALILGGVALCGLTVGGFFLLGGLGQPAKYQIPDDKDFVEFNPQNSALSCRIPKGWKQEWGGGSGGQPHWVRFTDGRFKIEARESISGGAMGQAAIAMKNKVDPAGQADFLSPATGIQEMQKHIVAENFDGYEEEPGRPIKTAGFGDGWIADFTAKEGFFKTGVRGCHATVLNSIHQYTVTCRCSPALFNDAKPLFEKVVKSMGVGSAP